MRYKVGDKVRIRTWEEMKKEFGLNSPGNINCYLCFENGMEEYLNSFCPDRIIIIKKVMEGNKNNNIYHMKEPNYWGWTDDMIECLAKDYKEPIPINSRFEILDL